MMVTAAEEEKDHWTGWARHELKGPVPATLPEWPAPGEWVTFSTLELLSSGLAVTLGARYLPPGKGFFG